VRRAATGKVGSRTPAEAVGESVQAERPGRLPLGGLCQVPRQAGGQAAGEGSAALDPAAAAADAPDAAGGRARLRSTPGT